MPADHTTRNLVRPTVNSGKMLHQVREDAEGALPSLLQALRAGLGPTLPSAASAGHGSYLGISCRHWGWRTAAESDPMVIRQMTSCDLSKPRRMAHSLLVYMQTRRARRGPAGPRSSTRQLRSRADSGQVEALSLSPGRSPGLSRPPRLFSLAAFAFGSPGPARATTSVVIQRDRNSL
jgi:hypothetical protein